ncbi:hypothetical protein B0H11DRAFT_1974546 [Mycena galericulata]|nr:hypothetical protein B0H11DRAFT_1974546 [Mycena galericulata]
MDIHCAILFLLLKFSCRLPTPTCAVLDTDADGMRREKRRTTPPRSRPRVARILIRSADYFAEGRGLRLCVFTAIARFEDSLHFCVSSASSASPRTGRSTLWIKLAAMGNSIADRVAESTI